MTAVGQLLRIGCAALLLAFGSSGPSMADSAAEEQQIRALDEEWVAAVARKDAAASAAFYAEDGAILPPNGPLAKGREAIAAVWQGLFGLANFDLTFAPTEVHVSSAADLAYEIGTYALSFSGDHGPVNDRGKYVVVWKKDDGAWKVVADIFNSNGASQ
jgi:uncharacterized protein (TIGR02246 family)